VCVLDIIYGLVTKKIAVGNLRKIIVTPEEDNLFLYIIIYGVTIVSKFYLKSANIYTNQHDTHELWGALWPTDILKQNSKSIAKQTHTETDMVKDIPV
jgi:hypothetical protein